jgi:hypothetical protein
MRHSAGGVGLAAVKPVFSGAAEPLSRSSAAKDEGEDFPAVPCLYPEINDGGNGDQRVKAPAVAKARVSLPQSTQGNIHQDCGQGKGHKKQDVHVYSLQAAEASHPETSAACD